MADQASHATLPENARSGSEETCDHLTNAQFADDKVEVGDGCARASTCNSDVTATPSNSSQTSATVTSGKETATVDTSSTGLTESGECPCIGDSISAQQASSGSSYQDVPSAQETYLPPSPLPVSCDTNSNTVSADMSNSFSDHTYYSPINSHSANPVTNKPSSNVDEMVIRHSVENEDISSPIAAAGRTSVDQVKPTAIVCTPEAVKYPVVQSLSHSTRQVKCRKTGHRRITANAANLSLGQLINAVSESCLGDSLDSTYIPASSLSSHSNAPVTTPVKTADISNCNAIRENLSGQFDRESVCSTGSQGNYSTTESQGSPQVDGVRRPPKARKSCQHDNSKVATDLPKEPSNRPAASFGTVCLAELVDTQSMAKLDVRSFDEMLVAKMRECMRPSNGYKMLLHNSEQSAMHTAVLPGTEEAMSVTSNDKAQGAGSGTPLIPSSAKTSDVIRQHEKQGQSGEKRVWRCRKSNWSPGSGHHSIGSKMNGELMHSGEKASESDVTTVEEQTTRRSPRCSKQITSWRQLDEVIPYEQWLKWFCEAGGGSPDEARF